MSSRMFLYLLDSSVSYIYIYILVKSSNRPLLKLGYKCSHAKYFYENLYLKSQVLYPSIAMRIIQIFSKTPRAKREVLKNEKCTWNSRDCICSNFYFTNHLLNVSLKRKLEQTTFCIIIRRMTTEKGARAVGILQQGAGIRQVSRGVCFFFGFFFFFFFFLVFFFEIPG